MLVVWGSAGQKDAFAYMMYWTEWENGDIYRANLDGTNKEALITTGITHPGSIALDVEGGKMYWGESSDGPTSVDLT